MESVNSMVDMELAGFFGGGGISLSLGGINYLWDDVIVHK